MGAIRFFSNDFLGFSKDRDLKNQVDKTFQNIANSMDKKAPILGSTGSRLISGNHCFIDHLESKLSDYHKSKASLICNSGYLANYALLSTLPQSDDLIILDEHIHASLREGALNSPAQVVHFKHNDLKHLKTQILRHQLGCQNIYITVNTIYSTGGKPAPLLELTKLSQLFNAKLIVDEAHATGVKGEQGLGLVEEYQLEDQIDIRIHTFGKALGACGAVILCPEEIKNYLINFSKPFIYSTALPLYNYVLIDQVYIKNMQSSSLRKKLNQNIDFFTTKALEMNLISEASDCAIQTLEIKNLCEGKRLESILLKNKIQIALLMPPTTRRQQVLVRICLHASHSKEQIDKLLAVIASFRESL